MAKDTSEGASDRAAKRYQRQYGAQAQRNKRQQNKRKQSRKGKR